MNILFISLGCDKNLVDSEVMLGLLSEKGYHITNDEKEADIIVVNTCCFINDAKEESIETLLEMAELKKSGQVKALIAAGCLAERYREEIQQEIKEVDAIVGTTGYEQIVSVIEQVLEGKQLGQFQDKNYLPLNNGKRINTTGGYFSYLKIAEGCNKFCTYCIIPKIRGSYRSYPIENLAAQAKALALQGIKELIIVAQETTLYGVDLYGEKSLPRLLRELCKIEGIEWIRLLYCYPEEITDELIQTIKEEPKICHYLDMPIQHASNSVLSQMGRKTNKQELLDKIELLRSNIPDICLRTTLISGFPGETEEDHRELAEFVNLVCFDRLGIFPYSPEEGTPAALMENQIEDTVKEERRNQLMELQQEISYDLSNELAGLTLKVLIEGKLADESVYIGRTYRDAPNVDGYIFVSSKRELLSGEFVMVKVTGAKEYDLIGDIVE